MSALGLLAVSVISIALILAGIGLDPEVPWWAVWGLTFIVLADTWNHL